MSHTPHTETEPLVARMNDLAIEVQKGYARIAELESELALARSTIEARDAELKRLREVKGCAFTRVAKNLKGDAYVGDDTLHLNAGVCAGDGLRARVVTAQIHFDNDNIKPGAVHVLNPDGTVGSEIKFKMLNLKLEPEWPQFICGYAVELDPPHHIKLSGHSLALGPLRRVVSHEIWGVEPTQSVRIAQDYPNCVAFTINGVCQSVPRAQLRALIAACEEKSNG